MTIQFYHNEQLFTATVVFNVHSTNIIMIKLRKQIDAFSEVIFLINTGDKWISDSPIETVFPSTYNNLIAQLTYVSNLTGREQRTSLVQCC